MPNVLPSIHSAARSQSDAVSVDERMRPYLIDAEPYYRASGNEVALFRAAFARGLPMIL